ncbi:neutral zinc metallopeptidase [Roseomonas sp. GC11]|uniref:neutral zinc metallopeptidase n=1 Tax=Roseomonas sp. GC11 TaxID=2950546 RepID=UPI002109732B|nr:neutral zinc metallopeptidase [Roseomonas sp. GC11]MCQ4159574.1 neutral zinc metallopeptidase [Roseomonas sp. GC11]
MRLDGLRREWNKLTGPGRGLVLGGLLALPLALLGATLLRHAPEGAGSPGRAPAAAPLQPPGPAEEQLVAQILEETNRTWGAQFARLKRSYQPSEPLLQTSLPPEACDRAPAAAGIFWCPADARIYVDLTRVARLRQQGGEAGMLAIGYLLAHAAGHHVQQQLGIIALVRGLQQRSQDPEEQRALWRRVEEQADCFAGLWARGASQAQTATTPGAVEAALAAAALDDARPLPPPTGYTAATEAAAQGDIAERATWFRTGMEKGDYVACDSFGGLR